MKGDSKKYKALKRTKKNNIFSSYLKDLDDAFRSTGKNDPTMRQAEQIETFLMITQYSQWGLTTNL